MRCGTQCELQRGFCVGIAGLVTRCARLGSFASREGWCSLTARALVYPPPSFAARSTTFGVCAANNHLRALLLVSQPRLQPKSQSFAFCSPH